MKCETPALATDSSREPAPIQSPIEAERTPSMRSVITRSPPGKRRRGGHGRIVVAAAAAALVSRRGRAGGVGCRATERYRGSSSCCSGCRVHGGQARHVCRGWPTLDDSWSSPRVRPTRPFTARIASSVPATYGVGLSPASWRIESRSPSAAKTASVETTKLGSRSECTCVPADGGAARLLGAEHVVDRDAERRGANAVEPLGELARGAARGVLLACARVVDHLPGVEVARSVDREAKEKRCREREVAGRDDADALRACARVDLVVVRRREAARADDDVDAALDRGEDVLPDERRRGCSRRERRPASRRALRRPTRSSPDRSARRRRRARGRAPPRSRPRPGAPSSR